MRRFPVAAIAIVGLAAQLNPAIAAPPPVSSQAPPVNTLLRPQGVLYQPTTEAAHMPTGSSVFSRDGLGSDGQTKRLVYVSYSSNEDYTDWNKATGGSQLSTDGGANFTRAPAFGILAPASDGSLIDIGAVNGMSTPTQANLTIRRSYDNGASWSDKQTVPLQMRLAAMPGHGIYPAGRVTTGFDSAGRQTILFPYYARLTGDDNGWRVEIARSIDDGKTWQTAGTVARPRAVTGGYASYTESAITYMPNGKLYAVMRVDLVAPGALQDFDQLPMEYAMSSDDGVTWTPTKQVTARPAGSNKVVTWPGVDPGLTTLPNGIVVMVAGRPDNNFAVSNSWLADGSPRWTNKEMFYSNYPTQGQAVRLRGSSGYAGVTPIGSNRAILVNDNCGPDPWGCPATSWGWTKDNEQKIMKFYLNASPRCLGVGAQVSDDLCADGGRRQCCRTSGVARPSGKIDLNSMIRSGKAVIVTDGFTATDAKYPTLRTMGAFDGSTDYWSSALARTGKPATMTLRLDKTRVLTQAGLSLQPGLSGSAEVRYSVDGTHWKSAGSFIQAGSRSVQYYPMPSGVTARYVQVTVQPSRVNATAIGSGGAMLNELELYSYP
jgi:hypothetical protein